MPPILTEASIKEAVLPLYIFFSCAMFNFPHLVTIQINENKNRSGLEKWLIENIDGPWEGSLIIKQNYYTNETLDIKIKESSEDSDPDKFSFSFSYSDLFKIPYNHLLVTAFKNEEDAVAFKLRWASK